MIKRATPRLVQLLATMINPLLHIILVIGLTSSAYSQAYTIIDKTAAIQLTKGWKNNAASVAPPLVHVSESDDGMAALTILKEIYSDVEINTLGDYTSLKIELLGDSYPDFNPTAPKMGEINGLRAAFFDSSATVETPDGTMFKANFSLMTVEGKSHFYLLIGLMREGAPAAARNEVIKMYKSFKETG